MKRLVFISVLFLSLISFSNISHAYNYYAETSGGPDTYTVEYTTAAIASISTNVVVVPLSSATAAGVSIWPHPTNARSIVIDSIQVENDKAAATTSSIKVGVVREINISSGTVVWFEQMSNTLNVSNTNNYQLIPYLNGGLDTRVNPVTPNFGPNTGTTPYILSNDITLASTFLTTALPLASPVSGQAIEFPRVGDIIINLNNGNAVSTMTVSVRYHITTN